MAIQSWNVTSGGRGFVVLSGVQRAPGRPPLEVQSCTVTGSTRDRASVQAVADWLAVTPSELRDEPTVDFFGFESVGDRRLPAPTNEADYRRDQLQGRIWQLTLSQSKRSASMQLMHFLAPSKPR